MRNPPRIVELEITLACNLRCLHCYCMAGRKSPDELTTEEIKSLMEDLKELGIWALDIVGGEPLVRPDLFDLMSFAREIGLRMMINTNGTLLTKKIVDRILESNPNVMMGVSLDGPDPETNDLVRGKGNFERAVRGIELLVEAGLDPVILHVVNAKNWTKFEEMIELARRLGVNKIYVDRFIPVGRGKESAGILDMSVKDWVRAISHIRRVIEKNENDMTFYVEENITGDPCTAGITHASILANGNVVPCGHFRYNEEFYMGNIRERKFSEIWNSYDPTASLGYPEECLSCPLLERCGGGCRAVSLHEFGGLDRVDLPICILNKSEGSLDLSVKW